MHPATRASPAHVVDGDDMRIAQGGRGPRLAVQPQHQVLLLGADEDLHGHLAAEPLVDRPPDLAHPAGAQKTDQPVPARQSDAAHDALLWPAPQVGPHAPGLCPGVVAQPT
ncbi:hypothetical protein [Streptomyces sp. NPDC048269]|uniref:hypothetical protein n=1 Tax=Streptomyces sp. NPDC048269 TaxID=3155753 RepID=UPI00343436EE